MELGRTHPLAHTGVFSDTGFRRSSGAHGARSRRAVWIASEVRLRVRIQWLMYRKRPGGRHDLPEHSFEHSNMHTSRRPASLMLTGLHTPESPVEPTGPNDTGSST